MDVAPLNLGMIAAYYYINYTTIGKPGVGWGWGGFLSIFACCKAGTFCIRKLDSYGSKTSIGYY